MCGIVGGVFRTTDMSIDNKLSVALGQMKNRGPNDNGYEVFNYSSTSHLVLGHTRLSVIDLSNAGHQPMYSIDGRYAVVFNGEIYNYKELREELKLLGWTFRSDSDTEVLLYAWAQWHEHSLTKFVGMFAFSIYDKQTNTLTCVRDPFGIKPFFYSKEAGLFRFASDIKALLGLQDSKPRLNWQRAYDYLVLNVYDNSEQSFIDDVFHLMPGHLLVVDLNSDIVSTPKKWWTPSLVEKECLSFAQATEQVRETFLSNIKLHLRSDVAIGAALSGGIDSSAVVCAMRYLEPDLDINTFSYIAKDSAVSEENWVDYINSYVNAKPHKVVCDANDLLGDLDDLVLSQGEPFGSTSIYAQYRVFKLARENDVTVTLDGQGADELLAGYRGYPLQRFKSILESQGIIEAVRYIKSWSAWPGRTKKEAVMCLTAALLSPELQAKAKGMFVATSKPQWLNTDLLQERGVDFGHKLGEHSPEFSGRRVVEMLQHCLQVDGLPQLLRHGDRNSMRFSVESRVPFLTAAMAELTLSMPEHYLISKNGETKSVFRAAMRGIVPDQVLDRKDKIGFATPEEIWLKSISGILREWLLEADDITFLNKSVLLSEFDLIMSGKKRFTWQVWRWVNFVKWYSNVGVRS